MQHGKCRPVTSPGERIETMTKTYTIDNTTYTVRTCTAIATGDTVRRNALYIDYYAESGEHVEYVVFNETLPEDEDEFIALFDYPDEWDGHYSTIATVCFAEGVNISNRVNAAAEHTRNARSLSECDDAVATICERAGMLSDLDEAADKTIILLKAAYILGVDVRGPWVAPHEIGTTNHRLFADPAAIELAETIRDAHDWESCKDECRQLCNMAGMADEWDNADGETFEGVLDRAAAKLHVRIR